MTPQTSFYRFSFTIFLIASFAASTGASAAKPPKKTVSAQSAPAQGPLYSSRAEAMQFADDLASRRDLDPDWVRNAIGQSR